MEIQGGDHHSIALEISENGKGRALIYSWGRNDDHQFGLGDKVNDYS